MLKTLEKWRKRVYYSVVKDLSDLIFSVINLYGKFKNNFRKNKKRKVNSKNHESYADDICI